MAEERVEFVEIFGAPESLLAHDLIIIFEELKVKIHLHSQICFINSGYIRTLIKDCKSDDILTRRDGIIFLKLEKLPISISVGSIEYVFKSIYGFDVEVKDRLMNICQQTNALIVLKEIFSFYDYLEVSLYIIQAAVLAKYLRPKPYFESKEDCFEIIELASKYKCTPLLNHFLFFSIQLPSHFASEKDSARLFRILPPEYTRILFHKGLNKISRDEMKVLFPTGFQGQTREGYI